MPVHLEDWTGEWSGSYLSIAVVSIATATASVRRPAAWRLPRAAREAAGRRGARLAHDDGAKNFNFELD